jgi:hypothetical protein
MMALIFASASPASAEDTRLAGGGLRRRCRAKQGTSRLQPGGLAEDPNGNAFPLRTPPHRPMHRRPCAAQRRGNRSRGRLRQIPMHQRGLGCLIERLPRPTAPPSTRCVASHRTTAKTCWRAPNGSTQSSHLVQSPQAHDSARHDRRNTSN